jgi:hypothetical protein
MDPGASQNALRPVLGCPEARLDEGQARKSSERDEMAALFGDIDVAALVHAEKVGDGLGRGDGSEEGAVARAEDGDVGVRNEERTRSEDRLEAPRDVRLERARPEDVTPAELARVGGRPGDGNELPGGSIADEGVVDGQP